MKNLMVKTLFVTVILGMVILCVPSLCYAANEDIVIVEKSENDYIIYIKPYLDKEFSFSFSNDEGADVTLLTFTNSAVDTEDGSNNIAFVDSTNKDMFANKTYMWIKVGDSVEVSAREVDINDNITSEDLENVGKVTKHIPITLDKEVITDETNEEGTKITETVGIAKLNNELKNGKYQLVKRADSEDSENLFALAELIEKNDFTDTYTRVKTSKEFAELAGKLLDSLNEADWKNIENSKVEQPKDAEDGEQYILWLKGDESADVHFLTSLRKYDEEKVKEDIKEVLPYTYDSNAILIALAVVFILIALVSIRIAILKIKEMV